MRKFILFLLAAVLPATVMKAQDADNLWDRGNTDYVNGAYADAIAHYDSIVTMGRESYKLYYNLGNAHFKEGHIGLSILNYRRARQLAPSNPDVKYNLSIANSYVKDNIEAVPEFFGSKWERAVRKLLSSNAWTTISLLALVLGLGSALLYLLSPGMGRRKTGFYLSAAFMLVFIVTTAFAAASKRELTDSEQAVVLESAISVRSSPDMASKEIFIIHEGTAVEILDTLGPWYEISIADGNKGWIEASAVEKI